MRLAALGLLLLFGCRNPAEGDRSPLPSGGYFVYGFASRPQLGTAILKLQVFDKDGNRTTAFRVLGSSGMPAMRGAHDTKDVPFQLNKKGDYLLPVEIAMPGEWEITLVFFDADKAVHRASFRFKV